MSERSVLVWSCVPFGPQPLCWLLRGSSSQQRRESSWHSFGPLAVGRNGSPKGDHLQRGQGGEDFTLQRLSRNQRHLGGTSVGGKAGLSKKGITRGIHWRDPEGKQDMNLWRTVDCGVPGRENKLESSCYEKSKAESQKKKRLRRKEKKGKRKQKIYIQENKK